MGDQVIKIIVKSESRGDEKVYIRHFIGSNTYYEDFKKKIVTRFPYLREKEYKLYWIDGDLDQITIFYEEDFRIFIENFETAKNRIYVEERSEKFVKFIPTTEPTVNQAKPPTPMSGPNYEIHPKHKHITCDGCQAEIVGTRYKCLECKDFDICMQCDQKLIHREHAMLRFYIPAEFIDWSNVRFDKFVRKFKHHGKHPEFPSKIEISVENEEPLKETQEKCEGRRHFKRGGRHNGHHKGGQHSNFWFNMMKYMNDLANQECPVVSSKAPAASANEPTPRSFCKTEQQATGMANAKENMTEEKDKYEEFNLANLINMITKTSMGVEMVNSGVNKVIENIIQATTPPVENSSEVSSECGNGPTESSIIKSDDSGRIKISPEVKKSVVAEPIKEPEESTSQSEVIANTKPPRSVDSTADPDEKEWDVIDEEIVLEKLEARRGSPALGAIPKEVAKEPTITLKNMSTNTSSNDIPTLISFEENTAPQNTIVNSSQNSIKSVEEEMPNYAKLGRDLQRHIQEQMSALQDNEKEIYHRKPNVNSAVITMMAMGFSNEGGWLTQLLDSVDGNISKALDLLQPNK